MGICPRCGSWVDDGDVCRSCGGVREVENNSNSYISRREYFIRKAIEASAEGNHSKAIALYERLGSRNRPNLIAIAKEYELMWDYDNALNIWDEAYSSFPNDISVVLGKANALYHLNRYNESISVYNEAISLYDELILEEEGEITSRFVSRSEVNKVISDIYAILGYKSLAEKYKKEAENDIDNYVEKELNKFNEYFNKGVCYSAKVHYERVLKYRPDGIPKDQLEECKRVLNLDYEGQRKYREQKEKELQRKEEKRKRKEERKRRKEQIRKYEEERKRREAEERKRRKECRKNPECIKKEIKTHKKMFKYSPVLLRSDKFQEDCNNSFREILEWENLLENLDIKEELTKEDIKLLKKENKYLKYCINHFKYEYRGNTLKLFVKNYKKLNKVSSVKSIFSSNEIEAFEVEVGARDKMDLANFLFNSISSSNEAINLQNALDLVNEAIAEILNYLNNKKANKYLNLLYLHKEIKQLRDKIEKAIIKFIKSHKDLFLIDMNKPLFIKPGSNLKLIKKDNEDVPVVYYENKPIATMYNNQDSDFENVFSNTESLKNLPKASNAKYFFKYRRFDIIEIK